MTLWAMLGTDLPDWTTFGISLSVVVVLFVTGLFFFRKTETSFADVI